MALAFLGVLVLAACVATGFRVSATPQSVAAATGSNGSDGVDGSPAALPGVVQVCTPSSGTQETGTGTEQPETAAIPPAAFSNWIIGSIASATGANEEGRNGRIRMATPLTLDPSWKTLRIATAEPAQKGLELITFTYDSNGAYLGTSGWHSLAEPFDFTIPAKAATFRAVVAYTPETTESTIVGGERSQWLKVTANPPVETGPPATTDPQFCTMQQGDIELADGSYGSATDRKEIRLAAPATINPAWTRLRFAGAANKSIAVFTYDESGAFLSGSGWQSLNQPFTFTLPQGTKEIAYAVRSGDGAGAISPDKHAATVSIADAPLTSDPAFTSLASGTLNEKIGTPEGGGTDIRSSALVYLDPAWKALRFGAALETTDATFAKTLYLLVLPYDAHGNYLGHTSGWQVLDATPFVYNLPPNTAAIRYELAYLNGGAIQPSDQSSWVTIEPTAPAPSYAFQKIKGGTIEPEFTVPGVNSSQTVAWVNGDIWTSSASSDNPIEGPEAPANGTITVYKIDWQTHQATQIHQFTDNFGHQNDWGFSAANDDMVIGNGGTALTLPPQFFVVPVKNIDLDGTNTLASTHAIKYTLPANWGDRPGTAWTEQPNVISVMTDGGQTIRKVRLDTGTDQGSLGTLQPAEEGQYNGTYELLGTWHTYNTLGGAPYPLAGSYPDQNQVWIDGKDVVSRADGEPNSMAVITLEPHGKLDYQITQDLSNKANFQGFFYDQEDGLMGGVTQNGNNSLFVWRAGNFSWMPQPNE